MASSGAFNTGGYQGRKLRFEWWENAQSIEGNYTDIGYRLKGYGDATSTWYMAGNFKLVVNGSNVYETAESNRIKLYNGTVLKTGTMRIYHNADGSKSFSASATGGIYTYARNVSGSGSWALDAIPRAATISSAPNFTDEDEPVLKYSNPAGSVVDDLQACIASTDGSTIYIDYRPISETGSSYTFSFTDEERETLQALCKNAKSMAVKFYIRTKLGSSTLYSSVEKTLTIANAAPTLAPTVKDSNATTKALTGDESKFIKGHSSAAYTIGASAKKQATIKSQKVTCGDKSATAASGTLAEVESAEFTFSVTDSRGYTTTKTLTKTLIDYVPLTCSMKVGTPTADGKCAMSISGDCFNGSFGAVANTLQVQYRVRSEGGGSSDVALTVAKTGYNIDASGNETALTGYAITNNIMANDGSAHRLDVKAGCVDRYMRLAEYDAGGGFIRRTLLDNALGATSFELELSEGTHYFRLCTNANDLQYYTLTRQSSGTWGAWVAADATLSGNGYSAEVAITGLDYQQAYTFQARAVDKLATVNTATKTVKATPVFDWGEDEFNFNVPVTMRNAAVLFGTNPEGENRAMVQMNADGDSFFGYGGYVNAEGRTFFDGNEVYIRSKEGVYIDGNLVADTIVAEGTSGMWTYRKWASGTAECWGEEEFNAGTTVAWGNVFTSTNGSSNFSFPFAFTDSPEIFGEFLAPNGNATISAVPPAGKERILSNFWPVWPAKVTANQTLTLHVYVIGRWK